MQVLLQPALKARFNPAMTKQEVNSAFSACASGIT
jgi:hypothetical protein